MRHQQTRDLFLYWSRLRGTEKAPHRNMIEPSDIRTLLPQTFILQQLADGTVEFRLAGTGLCAQFGNELRGQPFQMLFHPRDRRMLLRLVEQALQGDAISVLTMDGRSKSGRTVGFELLLLPLASESDGDRALGSALPAARMFWFGSDPIIEWKLRAVRIIDPEREMEFAANRPAIDVPPLVPARGAVQALAPRGRKVAHLTVLEGGRNR